MSTLTPIDRNHIDAELAAIGERAEKRAQRLRELAAEVDELTQSYDADQKRVQELKKLITT